MPRCVLVPSLRLRKGSTFITGNVIRSTCEPPSPRFLTKAYPTDTNNPFNRFVDLASATSEEIDQLSAACDPATFGRGNEDVYDETYRKAVKMDASNFAVQLDLARVGLIKIIEDKLLLSQQKEMSVSAEIYKLNVYGKLPLLVSWPSFG